LGSGKKATVGYHYRILKHVGLCKGPFDIFIEYRGGDKTAWKGVLPSVPESAGEALIMSGAFDDWALTWSGTIAIDAPNLWGGEKDQGGIEGSMDVLFGDAGQMPNDYLVANLGDQIPGWRGIATLVFKGGRYGAINPYPPVGSSKVKKVKVGWDNDACWFPERACVWPPGALPERTALLCLITENSEFLGSYYGHPEGNRYNWDRNYSETVREGAEFDDELTGVSASDAFTFVIDIPEDATSMWRFTREGMGGDNDHSQQFQLTTPDGAKHVAFPGYFPNFATAKAALNDTTYSIKGYTDYKFWYGFDFVMTSEAGTGYVKLYKSDFDRDCIEIFPDGPDMNPAHILYYSRTNSEMGRESPENFNEASMRAAAKWFFDKGIGLSTKRYPDQESPVEFEKRIARVAGCAFSRSLADGKWYIDIANGEYDIDALPILTDDDILEFTEQPATLDNAINSVSVSYFDVERKESITTPPARALGLVTAFGTIHQTYDFPEISNPNLALLIAQRELLATVTPTRAFELTTNRVPYTWRANQYFRLQAPKRGIADMVCIVGEIQTGTLRSGAIRLKAVQDIYSLPDTVYIEQETGVDTRPVQTPVAIATQRAIETPYIDVVAALSTAEREALDVEAGFVLSVAVDPSRHLDFTMRVAPDGEVVYTEVATGDYCPTALVVEEADDKTETEFTLADGVDLAQVEIGTAVLWDDEICRVDDIDVDAGTISLGRGCADTVPALHAAESRLWFYQTASAADETEYTAGETIQVKLLTNTGSQQLPEGSATPLSVTLDQRLARPYPPARLRLNGTAYLDTVSGALTVTWAHRDRLLQADQLIDTTAASIGPEPNTRYTLAFYDDTDTLIIEREDIGTPTAAVVLDYTGDVTLRLWSVSDSEVSLQVQEHTFAYTPLGGASSITATDYVPYIPVWEIDGNGA
jgi:hypothetical protein